KAFDALCAAELSYSHSDGHVEDKATFIANATNGKSKVLSLEYLDPQIRVVGTAAIVRFHWVGESQSVADGKKSNTNLHILMNWQKQGADWKLLSRASTKLCSRESAFKVRRGSAAPARPAAARRERPSHRRAAEQGDERAPRHSITLSERASTVAGISRPSALAVVRLITNSNLVGAC